MHAYTLIYSYPYKYYLYWHFIPIVTFHLISVISSCISWKCYTLTHHLFWTSTATPAVAQWHSKRFLTTLGTCPLQQLCQCTRVPCAHWKGWCSIRGIYINPHLANFTAWILVSSQTLHPNWLLCHYKWRESQMFCECFTQTHCSMPTALSSLCSVPTVGRWLQQVLKVKLIWVFLTKAWVVQSKVVHERCRENVPPQDRCKTKWLAD